MSSQGQIEKKGATSGELIPTVKIADPIPADAKALSQTNNVYFVIRRIYQTYNGGAD